MSIGRPARHGAQARATLSTAAGMKLWPPKPGLTDHDEDEIDQVDHMLEGGPRGCRGLRVTPRLLAQRPDRLQGTVDVRPGLHMHGDEIGARLGEGFQVGIARARS